MSDGVPEDGIPMFRVMVEGPSDEIIVKGLVRRLAPNAIFEIIVAKRPLNPKNGKILDIKSHKRDAKTLLIVFDQEYGTMADLPSYTSPVEGAVWCPAIPQIEAWLLADEKALYNAVPETARKIVERLPSPETIPYPKMVRHYILRDDWQIDKLFTAIDLDRAAVRCPSLAHFLTNIEICTGANKSFGFSEIASRQIDRDIIRSMISEVYPGSAPIFKASSGEIVTAEGMMHEIASGSLLGGEYATTMLRVARDFLARQAQREQKYNPK